jgi:hypothetical protein
VLSIVFPFSVKSVVFLPSSAPTYKTFDVADAVSVNGTMVVDNTFFIFRAYVISAVATASFAFSHSHHHPSSHHNGNTETLLYGQPM